MKKIILLTFFYAYLIFLNAQTNNEYNNSNNFIPIEIKCISYKSDRIIIKSEEEYMALYNPNTYYEPCQNYTLPKVDFDNYILIGINTSSEGCSLEIDESLTKDASRQSCDFIVKIIIEGVCRSNNRIYFWRLIPRQSDENCSYGIKIFKYPKK